MYIKLHGVYITLVGFVMETGFLFTIKWRLRQASTIMKGLPGRGWGRPSTALISVQSIIINLILVRMKMLREAYMPCHVYPSKLLVCVKCRKSVEPITDATKKYCDSFAKF